jgi:hypothetical protein
MTSALFGHVDLMLLYDVVAFAFENSQHVMEAMGKFQYQEK